jgi:hypothetical protein
MSTKNPSGDILDLVHGVMRAAPKLHGLMNRAHELIS